MFMETIDKKAVSEEIKIKKKPRPRVELDWNRSAGDCVAVPPPWHGKQGYIHIIDNKVCCIDIFYF
jgi:hypothetical protein